LVSMTAPNTQWLDIVKSCNKHATSPLFAIDVRLTCIPTRNGVTQGIMPDLRSVRCVIKVTDTL